MALRADDAKCRPCELYFPADVVAAQSYLAYSFDRLVTDWNRYVDKELSRCKDDDERVRKLSSLLHLNERLAAKGDATPQLERRHATKPPSGYASQQKKPNPLTEEEVAAMWNKQVAEMENIAAGNVGGAGLSFRQG